jgi:hypothetical protein
VETRWVALPCIPCHRQHARQTCVTQEVLQLEKRTDGRNLVANSAAAYQRETNLGQGSIDANAAGIAFGFARAVIIKGAEMPSALQAPGDSGSTGVI